MNGASFFKTGATVPIDPLAALFRSTCTDCGSSRIEWSPLADLLSRARDRQRIVELLDFLGSDADAWLCSECGAFGAFA